MIFSPQDLASLKIQRQTKKRKHRTSDIRHLDLDRKLDTFLATESRHQEKQTLARHQTLDSGPIPPDWFPHETWMDGSINH